MTYLLRSLKSLEKSNTSFTTIKGAIPVVKSDAALHLSGESSTTGSAIRYWLSAASPGEA